MRSAAARCSVLAIVRIARFAPSTWPPVSGAGNIRYASQSWAGVLSTDSGLVFAGGSGNLIAFDAKSGKNLWHFQTGSSLYAGAITYMVDGRQHVLMPSGTTLTAFALADFRD